MKPAGQERISVALFRRCAEAMFTDKMGNRERERKMGGKHHSLSRHTSNGDTNKFRA
jgi:hypothetical protein